MTAEAKGREFGSRRICVSILHIYIIGKYGCCCCLNLGKLGGRLFGKELFSRFITLVYFVNVYQFVFVLLFPLGFWELGLGFDCISSLSLPFF